MITLYHNPRCSKSREALALLTTLGHPFTIVEYLKTPLTTTELKALHTKLALPVRNMLREKEEEYNQLGLAETSLTDQHLIDAIALHPRLLERPIVVHGNLAAIGRPLSNITAILS
ncbi:arsenate reductase (glutaredoxin) [Alishewanella tabrizica]|uniref:Arsenate reductase n=1 Tax=Alishewanella tabrizica TaxID=671278 RepID=A0ABQ2WTK5_9ALTE|nr:arsenate reductase (glutaredoxin) [Alishewanella tabrizica]GGW67895.1 arsenate reductase [Alishewanella tabrizica]